MEFPVYVAFLVILDTPPEFFKHFVGEQKGIQFFHRGENNIFPGVHSRFAGFASERYGG